MNKNINELIKEEFYNLIKENIDYKNKQFNKYNEIDLNNLIGLKPSDFNEFSDKSAFEYHYNPEDFYGKIIDIGGDLYYFNYSGEYIRIPKITYNTKTKSYQYNKDVSDREKKYGDNIPKSGEFDVIHGSPYGKIDKFDEKKFGSGYQREELPHERFAGVYVSDDTNINKLTSTGYGEVHTYHVKFNNSIWEEDAKEILNKYEQKINKRLNRIQATKYIKSLGYDLIYRTFDDEDNMEYIVLDVNNIK